MEGHKSPANKSSSNISPDTCWVIIVLFTFHRYNKASANILEFAWSKRCVTKAKIQARLSLSGKYSILRCLFISPDY